MPRTHWTAAPPSPAGSTRAVSPGDPRRHLGTAYCWGDNDRGELGDDNLGADTGLPVPVAAPPGVTWKTR